MDSYLEEYIFSAVTLPIFLTSGAEAAATAGFLTGRFAVDEEGGVGDAVAVFVLDEKQLYCALFLHRQQ